jgi:hypothetical protein
MGILLETHQENECHALVRNIEESKTNRGFWKMKKIPVFVACVFTVIAALSLMAFAPAPLPSHANLGAVPTRAATRAPRSGEQADQELTFTLQRERNWLQRQTLHLNQANALIQKTQEVLNKAQAKGVDTTELSNALEVFKTQVAASQVSHDQAASLLNAKNGFDANNAVVDRQAAHQTLLDARNALREAHLTLQKGTLDLRSALQQWRTKNLAK